MRKLTDELIALIRQRSKRFKPRHAGEPERGSLPRRPRSVLFDVYGTLLLRIGDERRRQKERMRQIEALIRRRHLPVTASELDARLESAITRERSSRWSESNQHPEVDIESIWAVLFPRLSRAELRGAIVEYEIAAHPVWPAPGCRQLLRFLKRSGICIGIVSNAQFYTPLFLEATLGGNLEDLGFSPSLCVYSFELGVSKPDRSLYDLAAKRLALIGHRPKEAVIVGNNYLMDVAPAALAGFMTVRAAIDRRSSIPEPGTRCTPRAWKGRPHGRPMRGPDAVIRRLASLETLIEQAL